MKIIFAFDTTVPITQDGDAIIQESQLPNGIPVLLLHPNNLPFLVEMARRFSAETKQTVELMAVDMAEIVGSNFVSPSQAENMPAWYSIN